MAEHPDVLERVRAEQAAARPDLDKTITGEMLASMPYTRQVGTLDLFTHGLLPYTRQFADIEECVVLPCTEQVGDSRFDYLCAVAWAHCLPWCGTLGSKSTQAVYTVGVLYCVLVVCWENIY